MEVETLASTAITVLSPYLTKIGKGIASKASSAAWEKATELYDLIKDRFDKETDEYPSQTLERFEKEPEKRTAAMTEVLTEIIEKDSEFAGKLESLLLEAEKAGVGSVFNVSIFGGEVGEIINIDKLEGGLRISKREGKD